MASINASAHSEGLGGPAVAISQRPPSDIITNSGHHSLTSLQILRRVDQAKSETSVSQGHDNGISMITHLPNNMHGLQPQRDTFSPKTSKGQFHSALTLPRPQDHSRFAIGDDPHSHQSVEDSGHISEPQTSARSATTRQIAGTSIHNPISKALVDSAMDSDVFTQQRSQDSASMHLSQHHDSNQSSLFALPIQNHQSASTLLRTSYTQPHIGSQQIQVDDTPQLYQMLLDIHQSAQPLSRYHRAEDARKPDALPISSNMFNFEPQFASYRNQQAYNRQLSHMANDVLRSQHDISYQESHHGQRAQSSMERSPFRSQLGLPQIKEAHDRQLAQIPISASQYQPQIEFPQILEAPISEADQMAMSTLLDSEQTHLAQSRDIHDRQANYALKSVHQTRSRMEPPRNIEALNRQMGLLTTRDMHSDWQNGLQAGSRPAFWDQCRQDFGISQQFHPEPPARNTPSDFCGTTTLFPQLHLRPDSFRSQQFDALQGWPSSEKNVRIEPCFNPLYHIEPDMPSQMMHQSNQSIRKHVQLHQTPVLSASLSVGQTGPAAMHTLPSVTELSDFPSKSQSSSSSQVLSKAASDDLYASKQPPIGTPRAAGPKLALERPTGQGQATENEPTLSSLHYYPGSDIMYPYAKETPSEALQRLTAHGRLSIDKLLDTDVVPFMKGYENNRAVDWGVIRIGNIPYSLTRAEVINFLGSNAKVIPPALGTGVHIIMERTTGKTMDCYVEFQSVYEAQIAVNHLVYRGHALRLGHPPHDRVVNVTMSSQDELMKQLFPRAKNVVWVDGKPVIQASNEPFNTGFKTFITGEELVMMCKHAEQPHRSSYIQRCPQRTYECMISTLAKFPWYAVDHYTLGTREHIFNTTRDMLRHLVYFLKRGGLSNVNHNLLFEYMITGLNAAGFSERQRWELVQAAEHTGQSIRISPLSQWWPWEALGRRAGIEEDIVRYYARLITLHPTLQRTATDVEAGTSNPFGGNVEHDSVDITLAEAATKEWELFEAILRDVLRQSQSALNN